jgi:chromosome segregation ATPase
MKNIIFSGLTEKELDELDNVLNKYKNDIEDIEDYYEDINGETFTKIIMKVKLNDEINKLYKKNQDKQRKLRKLNTVKEIAKNKNIENYETLDISNRDGKRFKIIHNGRIVHFGLWPYSGEGAYIDHHNDDIKKAWQARHEKIKKNGIYAYKTKGTPSYYAYHLLW